MAARPPVELAQESGGAKAKKQKKTNGTNSDTAQSGAQTPAAEPEARQEPAEEPARSRGGARDLDPASGAELNDQGFALTDRAIPPAPYRSCRRRWHRGPKTAAS